MKIFLYEMIFRWLHLRLQFVNNQLIIQKKFYFWFIEHIEYFSCTFHSVIQLSTSTFKFRHCNAFPPNVWPSMTFASTFKFAQRSVQSSIEIKFPRIKIRQDSKFFSNNSIESCERRILVNHRSDKSSSPRVEVKNRSSDRSLMEFIAMHTKTNVPKTSTSKKRFFHSRQI